MEYSIDINLLPAKKRKKRRLSKENKRIISIGIFIGVILLAIYGGMYFQISSKTRHLSNLNNQIASLKHFEDALNNRSALGDKLGYYETTIEKLANSQITWNNLVQEIAESLPKETVIANLIVDRDKNLVTISGHTTDLQKLAWTVNSLMSNQNFSQVKVNSYTLPLGSKTSTSTGPQYATFTISFQWKEIKK